MKKMLWSLLTLGALIATSVLPAAAANAWPASSQGTDIGRGLPIGYEPSGVSWHSGRQQVLVVSDSGLVSAMNTDGSQVTTWQVGGDLEAVAVPDGSSNLVYLGVERPDSIVEFDLSTGQLTGKSWNLEAWMQSLDPNQGLEGLTYANGYFYASLQVDGTVHVFNVDRSTSGAVSQVSVMTPVSGRADLSDLFYSSETSTMYALYDGPNLLTEMKTDGTVVNEFTVPGTEQEGVALLPGCPSTTTSIFIAEDTPAHLWSYSGYPINCPVTPTPTPALTVSSVTGAANGDIDVVYSDSSTKHYSVFDITTRQKTTVTQIESTNDYLVTIWKRAAVVDAMSGQVLATRAIPKSYSLLWAWALAVAGL